MRRIHINKFVRFSSDKQLLDNISAHMGKGDVLSSLGGKKLDVAAVKAVFQQRVDATAAVDVKKAEYQGAVKSERETLAETEPMADYIRQALLALFRDKPEVLADLGLTPRKARKALTGEEMVAKAAKAKATREGHHAPVVVAPAPPAPVAIPPNPITPTTPSAAPVVVNGANGSAVPQ
jgi:hypothetical protein